MDVVIVGGSLSGLLHAIVFQHLGHKVHILEKSSPDVLQSQAAGLRAGPAVQKLVNQYIKPTKPYAKSISRTELINVDGRVLESFPGNGTMEFTTWQLLYELLKSHLLSEGATQPAIYETNKRVRDVRYGGGKVEVADFDTGTRVSNVLQADLVISADGGHSSVREIVAPGFKLTYAGYVTWRGAVDESVISEASRKSLSNKATFLRTENGYILSYHVPSEKGSLEPGDCQFIWVWYQKLDESSAEFRDIFTDSSGTRHFTTIPRGKMLPWPDVWKELYERGSSLSTPFAELLENTTDPFVSAIRDGSAPKAVFHDGKLLLVGDAFSLFRPHVASSTDQAAMQALGLVEVFRGERDVAEWEKTSMEYAAKTSALSVAFGEYCFTGKADESLIPLLRADDQPS